MDDARIDAVAQFLRAYRHPVTPQVPYREIAAGALAAADAESASECEKLKAALRELYDFTLNYTTSPFRSQQIVEGRLRILETARALVGSVPQTPTEA